MKTSNSRPRRTCSLSHLWRHQFNITRYSWSANSRVRIALSSQQSVLDIDGIPTNKIEKRYHCWWKNGGKMAHHTHNWHPTFCDSQEEYETQKEARVKGPRKMKGSRKKVRNGQVRNNTKPFSQTHGRCNCFFTAGEKWTKVEYQIKNFFIQNAISFSPLNENKFNYQIVTYLWC